MHLAMTGVTAPSHVYPSLALIAERCLAGIASATSSASGSPRWWPRPAPESSPTPHCCLTTTASGPTMPARRYKRRRDGHEVASNAAIPAASTHWETPVSLGGHVIGPCSEAILRSGDWGRFHQPVPRMISHSNLIMASRSMGAVCLAARSSTPPTPVTPTLGYSAP